MINTIENLREKEGLSKAKLAREVGISLKQYYNYLNGSSIPFTVVEDLLNVFGLKLIITVDNIKRL